MDISAVVFSLNCVCSPDLSWIELFGSKGKSPPVAAVCCDRSSIEVHHREYRFQRLLYLDNNLIIEPLLSRLEWSLGSRNR